MNKRPLPLSQNHGFTLVEALVVMALLTGFLLMLTTLLTSAIDIQNSSEGQSALVNDGRFITARLDYDIARAAAVTTPGTLGGTSSSLILSIGGDSYAYTLSSGSLQLTDPSGSVQLNSSGTTVSGLSFQTLGNSGGKATVRYTLTLTSTARSASGSSVQTITSTAGLR